jgi:hypothetical protein
MEGALPATRTLLPRIHWRLLLQAITVVFVVLSWLFLQRFIGDGVDAHAYWLTRGGIEYGVAGGSDAYLYSPAFAQAIRPIALLDWPTFYAVWTAILIGALVYIGGPVGGMVMLALPPVAGEVITGNIHILLAAVVVAGFRHPGAWAFALLTKVTPGVGMVWFVVRREWCAVGIVLVTTLAISVVSFALDPPAWGSWLGALAGSSSTPKSDAVAIPLAIRLPLALAIVALGGWRGWRWTVIVAAMLAVPVMWAYHWRWAVMLIGLWPILAERVDADAVFVRRRRDAAERAV